MYKKNVIKPLAVLAAASLFTACASYDTAYEADKVLVCHKGKTLVIPANALQAHLGHGDERGECQ